MHKNGTELSCHRNKNEKMKNLHFTGDIKRHANFSIILKALTSSVNVNYKLNGRELILYMK